MTEVCTIMQHNVIHETEEIGSTAVITWVLSIKSMINKDVRNIVYQ